MSLGYFLTFRHRKLKPTEISSSHRDQILFTHCPCAQEPWLILLSCNILIPGVQFSLWLYPSLISFSPTILRRFCFLPITLCCDSPIFFKHTKYIKELPTGCCHLNSPGHCALFKFEHMVVLCLDFQFSARVLTHIPQLYGVPLF